jgi:hypothetical protein
MSLNNFKVLMLFYRLSKYSWALAASSVSNGLADPESRQTKAAHKKGKKGRYYFTSSFRSSLEGSRLLLQPPTFIVQNLKKKSIAFILLQKNSFSNNIANFLIKTSSGKDWIWQQ